MLRTPVLLFALACTALGCSSPKGPALYRVASSINATLRVGEELIEPGDLLQVLVETEMATGAAAEGPDGQGPGAQGPGAQDDGAGLQTVRVQPDGNAAFEGVGPIDVAGLLPTVLGELLAGRFAATLDAEPSVTVVVLERAPRTITVFGEVGRPGIVALPAEGRLALVAALGQAGGPRKRNAWLSNTLLVRVDTTTGEPQSWTIDARQQHWGKGDAVYLQHGDVLFVPNTNVDRVAIGLDNYVRRMIPFPYLAPPSD